MNFKSPDKKEIKEKYGIPDEDFDILVADKLPKATDLLQNESFIVKTMSYFGIPTFLRKNKWGIIIAIIFLPYIKDKVSNELENCYVTTFSYYKEVASNLAPKQGVEPVLVAVLPQNKELKPYKGKMPMDALPEDTGIYPYSGDGINLQKYKV